MGITKEPLGNIEGHNKVIGVIFRGHKFILKGGFGSFLSTRPLRKDCPMISEDSDWTRHGHKNHSYVG